MSKLKINRGKKYEIRIPNGKNPKRIFRGKAGWRSTFWVLIEGTCERKGRLIRGKYHAVFLGNYEAIELPEEEET